MTEHNTENIHALVEQCGPGTIEEEIIPVSGGFMHKMYKVHTTAGAYAVKCLNPEIMSRPDVMENYAEAERLERILEDNGLPVVAALSFGGKKMIPVNGRYFYIFPWLEGKITDFNDISKEQCFTAGSLTGRIHCIDAHNIEAKESELSEVDFNALLDGALKKESVIASALKENIALLENAQKSLNEARKKLPSMSSICDDDMDPKNVMWHEGKAYIIDLECLEYGNPISSALNLAIQWCGTVTGNFNKDNLEEFFKGYLQSYDNGFRSYDELFGIAYTWIEWLEYNIKRALGMVSSDPEEIKLGETETLNTIDRIKYLASIEGDICSVLRNLPAPDSCHYKTHDDSLCYIDLVFEGELNDIPGYELPEGYRFVTYKDGDKKDWIDIELSAEEVLSTEHGEECWQRYYGNAESLLPGRMYFIEDETGNKVATATAFYDIHGNAGPGEGQLHWVAVKKEAQGKGLSKPLITYVLGVMKELGYTSTKIHTQTNTWLACKVYADLGFRPEAKSISENRAGWKMVELLTNRKMLEEWDVYTIDRKLTGKTCFRGEQDILSDDEFHLWVMVWIKNPETGKYLVSQRVADKEVDPLKWETVAGHSICGETSAQAAVREAYEEVGISFRPEDAKVLVTKVATSYDGHRYNYIRDSFYFETTEEPDLSKATTKEVLQTKWLSFPEIREMYERGECCLNMGDIYGFELNPVPADRYRDIIGQIVKGVIDRPLGSCHPRKKNLYYPVNYGYVTGVIGGDGAEQDIYLLGETGPVSEFIGKVIAVYHRYDDNETKWIVLPCDENGIIRRDIEIPSDDEIYAQIAFQEQFFYGVLVKG